LIQNFQLGLKEINDLHNFKYVTLPENRGKGFAMATGIESTASEIIVFIDADLSNCKRQLTMYIFSQLTMYSF
jgi:glycosyltransferase involved in cell wall biosynthesis